MSVAEQSEEHEPMNDAGEENTSKRVAKDVKGKGNKETLQRDIKRALRKRASYIKANSE